PVRGRRDAHRRRHSVADGHPAAVAMIQDARYAIRSLLRSPSYAVAAILTLAIGIAVNTIAATLLDSLVFRPLPVRDPARVVRIVPIDEHGRRANLISYPDFGDYRDQARGFDGLAAYIPVAITLGDARRSEADRQTGVGFAVSANYFSVLGIEPSVGRT